MNTDNEQKKRFIEIIKHGLSILEESDNFNSKKEALIIIDTALFFRYGSGSYTLRFRQLQDKSYDNVFSLTQEAILDH